MNTIKITEKELIYAQDIIENNKCDERCMFCPIEDDCRMADTVIEAAEMIIQQSKVESGEITLISVKHIDEYRQIMKDHGKDKAIEFALAKIDK